jgi:hypothetical protein
MPLDSTAEDIGKAVEQGIALCESSPAELRVT